MRSAFLIVFIVVGTALSGCTPSRDSSNANVDPDSLAIHPANIEPANVPNPRDPARRKRVDADPNASPAPPEFRPADESSQVGVSMLPDGSVLETRIFSEHPQVLKVESNWLEPEKKNVRVYLRDGRILSAETGKLGALRSASVAEILQLVGVKAQAGR